jgi:hypothetical protein
LTAFAKAEQGIRMMRGEATVIYEYRVKGMNSSFHSHIGAVEAQQ